MLNTAIAITVNGQNHVVLYLDAKLSTHENPKPVKCRMCRN